MTSGGEHVADALVRHGVRFLFTLCGGHIAPILVAAKARGIRVVDVRDEAAAVFAADAVSRLTGTPGVAAVTAGPGVTNTLTAVKNAQLAHSPVVLLGGATGTVLKGRGALQDIDQRALMAPHVKRVWEVRRVRDLAPALSEAFAAACRGVPGPVFVECPVDLLYERQLVQRVYGVGDDAPPPRDLAAGLVRRYLAWHVGRLFAGADGAAPPAVQPVAPPTPAAVEVERAAAALARASRPLALVGSQAVLEAPAVDEVAAAVERLGVPVYLSGMARGLLGAEHPLLLRHRRRQALAEADLVLLAGVPCDFRLDYGRHLRRARRIAVNRSAAEMARNRRPHLGVVADPGAFLRSLAAISPATGDAWSAWRESLRVRDREREEEIVRRAAEATEHVNPLYLCREIDRALADDSVLVADGGDFVATASYVVRPRGPLRWLDPGVFGTLGVGGGFALGARLARPTAEVWLLWGDGSAAYSLAEVDTFVRHGLGVIAVVGNDAGWMQIAREQVEVLGDDTGTVLRHSDYHRVAEGFGGVGLKIERPEEVPGVLARAKEEAAAGVPVLVNALLGRTDFRKGSISM